jgi:ribosomal protein S18 acetylase RimI-like enzyme
MKKYQIRKAREEDIPEIIALCIKHAQFEKANYSPEGKSEKLSKMLFHDTYQLQCLLVESEGKAVGYATFSKECSTWNAAYYTHMDCLYLEEEFRGLGIGEALANKIIQFSKDSNANHIEWQTPNFNECAIRFYKRLGATGLEKLRFTLKL